MSTTRFQGCHQTTPELLLSIVFIFISWSFYLWNAINILAQMLIKRQTNKQTKKIHHMQNSPKFLNQHFIQT